MFRVIRRDLDEKVKKYADSYLTEESLWGLKREAIEYDDIDDAYKRMIFERDCSPYRNTGNYKYRVEEE